MAAAPRPWTVLPHGPLEKVERNLWLVVGSPPRGHVPRRMSIIRLDDGRVLLHNAVPLSEPAMREVEQWGEPALLVVPSAHHRLDLFAFKQRYARLKVVCPAQAEARVRQVVAVDGHWDALPDDPSLGVEVLAGSRAGEAAFVVRHPQAGRLSLLFGDTIMNLPHLPGLDGLLFNLIGSTGGPRVTPLAKLATVNDKRALRAHLEALAALPGLARLVPSHGDVVAEDAPETLRWIAEGV